MARGRKTGGRDFKPGQGGRKRGVPNKAMREIKEFARTVLEDPIGQAKVIELYRRGKLPPPVHVQLLYFAYGKPKETVQVQGMAPLVIHIVDEYADPADVPPEARRALEQAEAYEREVGVVLPMERRA